MAFVFSNRELTYISKTFFSYDHHYLHVVSVFEVNSRSLILSLITHSGELSPKDRIFSDASEHTYIASFAKLYSRQDIYLFN